jgi:general secretion pathway protein F/type IV pilus assembly protein PilC
VLFGVLLLSVWFAICGALVFLIHFILTLPMRRAERARLFLDLVDSAITQGRPLEETLISASYSGDPALGARFHLVAAWLERNLSLSDALDKVPRYLPPQITAMLTAGRKIGDLGKVLPACRQLLKDAVSQTRGAINYLVILTFVITPLGVGVFTFMGVTVVPKFKEISVAMGGNASAIAFLYDHSAALVASQIGLLLLLWIAALIYIGGPRDALRFPVLDRLYFRLPWRRKRMQRDFSTLLAILLDSGVPEPDAVALAADGTANTAFRRRAARVVENLKRGMNLTQAVQALDDTGEFAWRLANAAHGHTGFLQALAGWHESLDARAFQQEQAAAHFITSALVLWSGLFVGAIAVSAFMFLCSFYNTAVLW